jgi:hypothetical protein
MNINENRKKFTKKRNLGIVESIIYRIHLFFIEYKLFK